MSTSDILKQILINKVNKKNEDGQTEQEPQPYDQKQSSGQSQPDEYRQSKPQQNEPQRYEPQPYEPQAEDRSAAEGEQYSGVVPDVYADSDNNTEEDDQLSEEQQQEQDEDQAKQEVVEKLLEGLF